MNAPADPHLFLSATPRLEIDGVENAMAAELLVSLDMTESEGGLSSLEMCFTNAANVEGVGSDMPFESESNDAFSLGAELRVVTGQNHDPTEIFQGKISAIELVMDGADAPQMIILAEDILQSARMKRRTKLHEQSTLGDLVDSLMADHGIQVVAADLSMPILAELQNNETDLGFLRRICARFDVDFQIVGKEMHISPRALVDRGVRVLEFGQTLTRFRGLVDLSEQVSSVTVSGWDHSANTSFEVESGAGAQAGGGSGTPAIAFLEDRFAPRKEHVAEADIPDAETAQALADSLHAARARRFVSVEATVSGDPSLRVGTQVDVKGVGSRFENIYYVTHAQHQFSPEAGGYTTDFRAECAFWGG